jgi:AcrR family transcriptional regulator
MTHPDFMRARSSAAKLERERAILDAARVLASESGLREVTLTDIAAAVGMHKSAMLRYFETREQIFLTLAAHEWRAWSTEVRRRLVEQADAAPADLAGVLSESLVERPFFCDLLAHTSLALERNVSLESVRTYKRQVLVDVGSVSAALGEKAPLGDEQARDLISTATSMAGALWQMAAPGTTLRTLYESDRELAHAVVDVGPQLTRILTALISGMLQEKY